MLFITGTPAGGLSLAAQIFFKHGFVFPEDCHVNKNVHSQKLHNVHRSFFLACNFTVLNPVDIKLTAQHLYLMQNFLDANPHMTAMVDVNFAFTRHIWKKIIDDIDYVVTFRHPAQSSYSMARSHGIARMTAYSVWQNYASAVESIMGPFVEFGSDVPLEETLDFYRSAFQFLDLDFSEKAFDQSYDGRKIHNAATHHTTPGCTKFYNALLNRLEL